MMWFKIFCDGYGVDFDFAVDLDSCGRNWSDGSVHHLFFGRGVKENLDTRFDERIGLKDFSRSVVAGRFKLQGRSVLVEPGQVGANMGPGLWQFHEFQLHCLRKGFLANEFPYWITGLEPWTKNGSLSQLVQPSALSPGDTLFAHFRLGDCAYFTGEQLSTLLGQKVAAHAISCDGVFDERGFDLYRSGLHSKFAARHYAERGARQVSIHKFEDAINRLGIESPGVTFSTDGFTRISKVISKVVDLSADVVEERLNLVLEPLLSTSERCYVGERGNLLPSVLCNVVQSTRLLTTTSLFALTVKAAVMGRSVLKCWRYLDESSQLDKYFQLPALVDMPLYRLEAQLHRLMLAENA